MKQTVTLPASVRSVFEPPCMEIFVFVPAEDVITTSDIELPRDPFDLEP